MSKLNITLAGPQPARSKVQSRIFRGQKRQHVVNLVMGILRDRRLTIFEHEGSTRQGLRAALCLEGHGWHRADEEAAAIVAHALRLLGAVRPTWYQGQPEYSAGHEYCLGCRGPLDEADIANARRFCCDDCARTTMNARPEIHRFATDMARYAAYYAASKEKIPDRECAACGETFRPATLGTKACSPKCAARTRKDAVPEKRCECCNTPFRPHSRKSVGRFCSNECHNEFNRTALPMRECAHCKSEFRPIKTFQRYCDSQCSNQANYERRKIRMAKARESAFVCEEVAGFKEAAE